MEIKILVLYIGVAGLRSEDLNDYVDRVTAKIVPQTFVGEIIVIPTQSLQAPDARIECINPLYVTETELIVHHTEMMKKLQNELQTQLDILKENKNENI